MITQELLWPVHRTKLYSLSKLELVDCLQKSEDSIQEYKDRLQKSEGSIQEYKDRLQKSEGMNRQLQKENESLKKENEGLKNEGLKNEGLKKENEGLKKEVKSSNKVVKNLSAFLREKGYHNILLKNKIFGKSSEKKPSSNPPVRSKPRRRSVKPVKRVQLPSEKYPEAHVEEKDIELDSLPNCPSCGKGMVDSGMTADSEQLTVIPRKFVITRQKRHKYKCTHCHGSIKTAPAPPRIKAKSTYSDKTMLDASLSKYCDLIPMERYSDMAERSDLGRIPPHSLIQLTHYVAAYFKEAYGELKGEIQSSRVLHADETSHKMLERNDNKKWYLWGFLNSKASYFEIHNTRSGDVALRILQDSRCEYLVTDAFGGYSRAVRELNEDRGSSKNLPVISNAYCNAHARRKFHESILVNNKEFHDKAKYFVDIYQNIYRLEEFARGRAPDRVLRARGFMEPLFEQMKAKAIKQVEGDSSKSPIRTAMVYFLKNYEELTLFLKKPHVPIDNNPQERQLRCPVVGRKTWYGTHSKKGAQTNAILFSLVESCKLNKVNPRKYFEDLVKDLHQGKKSYTPYQYKKLSEDSSTKDDYG